MHSNGANHNNSNNNRIKCISHKEMDIINNSNNNKTGGQMTSE